MPQLKDCLLQSCCHPRIASFNPVVTPGLRGTPRGTPRGQLRKNGTSTRNSTRGNSQFRTPRGLCFRASHSCPASEASIPSAPHSCRATCPASEPPACQARAKVGILPRKKCRGCRLSRQPLRIFSSCPVGGQLSKVSANLPGRAAPARRHGRRQSWGLAAIGKKKACCSPPTGGLDFFLGRIPTLARARQGSDAGQARQGG